MDTLFKLFRKIRNLFPSQVPQGIEEFDAYVDSIFADYILPTSLRSDVEWLVANTVLRFSPTEATKSKYHFVLTIRAAAAKQIASVKLHELKEAQQKRALEATKTEQVATSGPTN